ncbi:hypothetical protein RGQ29_011400 [Quercus rubra]|uniref:Uncharacterized protein n=1 Tax=Quercus rubra TaxID=3512 RepID=A0AAN7G6X9_QUERU|nr:hypothetical protein RGQ29_011400 [Quercus rubra]
MAEVDWNNQRSKRMIEEQAKEELEILETQHPNRFEYLKLELKSFIFHIQSQSQLPLPENYSPSSFPTSSIATTQESTSNRKRKVGDCLCVLMEDGNESPKKKLQMGTTNIMGNMKGITTNRKINNRERVDEVLERAQACLQKIQHLKASLLFCC